MHNLRIPSSTVSISPRKIVVDEKRKKPKQMLWTDLCVIWHRRGRRRRVNTVNRNYNKHITNGQFSGRIQIHHRYALALLIPWREISFSERGHLRDRETRKFEHFEWMEIWYARMSSVCLCWAFFTIAMLLELVPCTWCARRAASNRLHCAHASKVDAHFLLDFRRVATAYATAIGMSEIRRN